jgi:biotin carboxylase
MRILVVGTNRMCHDRLREHGHEMVLFVPRGKARREDPAGPYRHVVVLEDQAGIEFWVDVARAFHRSIRFEAVVAYNEHTYHIVRAISDELNIPTVVDVDLFDRVLDKYTMREILKKHEVPSCRYELARGQEAVLAAVQNIGVPCIVKPVNGEASVGVAKIESFADIGACLQQVGDEHIDRGVLVEEFLIGEEFSVEGISIGALHHIVAITKKFRDDRTFVERGHLVPAPVNAAARESIVNYVERVLDVLNFHDCPSHTEIVLTARGPRIIETHNRIGGDSIMDLVRLATGVDMYDLVARQSLGEDVTAMLPDQIGHRQSAVIWYADPGGPSTNALVEVKDVERVRELSYVQRVELLKEPGSPQTAVRQSSDRSGLVVVVGDTPEEAVRRAQEAIRMLKFIYTWNPEDGTFASGH